MAEGEARLSCMWKKAKARALQILNESAPTKVLALGNGGIY